MKDDFQIKQSEWLSIWEHLKNSPIEEVESVYEKTFGNPIGHYPEMDKWQMIEEILEEIMEVK